MLATGGEICRVARETQSPLLVSVSGRTVGSQGEGWGRGARGRGLLG